MTKLYQPSLKKIHSTNLYKFQKAVEKKFNRKFSDYKKFWQWSNQYPHQFWNFLIFYFNIPLVQKKSFQIFNKKPQFWKTVFFDKSLINYYQLIFNNMSRDLAIHFVGENNFEEKITYENLNNRVNSLSNYFKSLKIKKGDVIAGYLPNIPDTIISFLAAAKVGAVWSSCSSDFGIKAVVDRFSQLNPKVLIIGDYYFYNGKKFDYSKNLFQLKRKLNNPKIINAGYPSKNQKSQLSKIYSNKRYTVNNPPEQVEFNHPLYVLYSSGTTGLPKCITHGHGGSLIQHFKELSLHTNVKKNTKMFFLTTCGWMMWNWTVSNLLLGSSIVLYDGSPFFPRANRIINISKKTKTTMLGAGAKIYETIQNIHKSQTKNVLKNIECFISTGSPLSPETFKFINKKLNSNAFIYSVSGGTDIVSCFMLGVPTLPVFAGEIQGPGLGMNIDVFDEKGKLIYFAGDQNPISLEDVRRYNFNKIMD